MILARVLIIEDESGIALALYRSLDKQGYDVAVAKTGNSGLRKARSVTYDCIVLDLSLPDMTGLSVCRQLRADGLTMPMIILTGESTVRSKVSLLDAGANDYVTKPFSFDELEARIRACIRVEVTPQASSLLQIGCLRLDVLNRIAFRDTIDIRLRRKETALLECLMLHAGVTVTRNRLIEHAWNNGQDAWSNTIDVHIKHLRDKIDRPFSEPLIETVYGIGYKLKVPSSVAKIP